MNAAASGETRRWMGQGGVNKRSEDSVGKFCLNVRGGESRRNEVGSSNRGGRRWVRGRKGSRRWERTKEGHGKREQGEEGMRGGGGAVEWKTSLDSLLRCFLPPHAAANFLSAAFLLLPAHCTYEETPEAVFSSWSQVALRSATRNRFFKSHGKS